MPHLYGESEGAEHFGLVVEDLRGVVQQKKRVFQQDGPELFPLEAPTLVPFHQMRKFLIASEENLPNILQQIHDLLMSKYRILVLDKEDDSLAQPDGGAGEQERLANKDLQSFLLGEMQVVLEDGEPFPVEEVEFVMDEVGAAGEDGGGCRLVEAVGLEGSDEVQDVLLAHLEQQVSAVEEQFVDEGGQRLSLLQLVQELDLGLDLGACVKGGLRSWEPGMKTCGLRWKSFSTPRWEREYFLAMSLTSLSSWMGDGLRGRRRSGSTARGGACRVVSGRFWRCGRRRRTVRSAL